VSVQFSRTNGLLSGTLARSAEGGEFDGWSDMSRGFPPVQVTCIMPMIDKGWNSYLDGHSLKTSVSRRVLVLRSA
jgi:hypothetical protein